MGDYRSRPQRYDRAFARRVLIQEKRKGEKENEYRNRSERQQDKSSRDVLSSGHSTQSHSGIKDQSKTHTRRGQAGGTCSQHSPAWHPSASSRPPLAKR